MALHPSCMVRGRAGGFPLLVAALAVGGSACGARDSLLYDDGQGGAPTGQAGRGSPPTGRSGAPSGAPSFGGSASASGGASGSSGASGSTTGSAGAGGATSCGCDSLHFCSTGTCVLRATTIAARGGTTCVTLVDGSLRCWGSGASGVLGDGLTRGASAPVAPFDIPHGTAIAKAVDFGGDYACATLSNESLWCWGSNADARIAQGASQSALTPVPVEGLLAGQGVKAFAPGVASGCALLGGNGVQCWGSNARGQLGDGSNTSSAVPRSVLGLPSQQAFTLAIVGGDRHVCVSFSDGQIGCWGDNSAGQLGFPEIPSRNVLDYVHDLTNANEQVTAMAAGSRHTCVLFSNQQVACWGDNSLGQLGNGASGGVSSTPVPVVGLEVGAVQPIELSARGQRTCALNSDGSVDCWGAQSAQSTDGTPSDSGTPIRVVGLPEAGKKAVALSVGESHACVLLDDGSPRCWGDNSFGQLTGQTSAELWLTPQRLSVAW